MTASDDLPDYPAGPRSTIISAEGVERVNDHCLKIYVAGAIRGGRDFIRNYQKLIDALDGREDCVALAEMSLVGRGTMLRDDTAIYQRDRAWLDEAAAMVAEVSSPSLGVGYEIAYALHVRRIPVLALWHASLKRISAMIGGNPSPLLQLQAYASGAELLQATDRFIRSLRPGAESPLD